jgi:UDP-N-acetylglucosamine 2-epimerase (non-hydrolysing)
LNRRHLLIVAGTRPEVIKLAPIVLAAKQRFAARVHLELCLTGQHRTMVDEALSIFSIKGDHDLNIMVANQTPNDVSRGIFDKLPGILERSKPDVVVVQGDTTSAAVASFCAFNLKIPVAHVEAGLRSYDLAAPFPEELNRKVVTCAARFNFCPTESARENLRREAVPDDTIVVTGNTIVDALRIVSEAHDLSDPTVVDRSIKSPFVLVTAHRRESFGNGIVNICTGIKECARLLPGHQFVYPVHLNPNINKPVREILANIPNVKLLPPVSYLNLLRLLRNCDLVMSDSGGIQEEAPSFGKYCAVLRDVTERGEGVRLGLSELVGTETNRIVQSVTRRLTMNQTYPSVPNPYGDGHAAEKILEHLAGEGSSV